MGRWAILNVVLGLIVILLVVQLVMTWTRSLPPVPVVARGAGTDASEPGRGAGGKRSKRAGTEREVPPAVMVATIVNKDLFDPSRQKATATPEATVEAPKETGPPPNLSLVGVRMIGRDREAFLIDTGKGNEQQRLREGDEIGGFTVKTIEARRVTLNNAGGEVINLTLTVESSSGGGGAPGIPGGAAPRPGRPPMPAAPGGGSPAAGAMGNSPAAGVVPSASSMPPVVPGRPGGPGIGADGAAAAAAAARRGVVQPPPQVPQLPAGVREKLEQLKGKQ
jgi:hypothetical protein